MHRALQQEVEAKTQEDMDADEEGEKFVLAMEREERKKTACLADDSGIMFTTAVCAAIVIFF